MAASNYECSDHYVWKRFAAVIRQYERGKSSAIEVTAWLRAAKAPSLITIKRRYGLWSVQQLLDFAWSDQVPPYKTDAVAPPPGRARNATTGQGIAPPPPPLDIDAQGNPKPAVYETPFAKWNIPAEELSGEDAWSALVSASKLRQKAESTIRRRAIDIPGDSPIGIICMGDMHIGSIGTDYDRLDSVIGMIESDSRVYAISIGDILDSMVWRTVMHEGRKSPVDFPGEVRAGAHFLKRLAGTQRFLGICAGNHDLISGKLSGYSALEGVVEYVISHIPYHPYQLDLELKLGGVTYTMTLRHSVQGASQYNPAHGVMRHQRFNGDECDIVVAGHTHRSSYQSSFIQGKDRWGVQVGAYKLHALDGYALERGFADEKSQPDYMVILWPHQRKIEVMNTTTGLALLRNRSLTSCSNSPRGRTPGTSKTAASSASSSREAIRSRSHAKRPRRSEPRSRSTKTATSYHRRTQRRRPSSNG